MYQSKAKATPEQKRRQKERERTGNYHNPGDWGGRGDTWTDRSEPVYDRHGNQIGTYTPDRRN